MQRGVEKEVKARTLKRSMEDSVRCATVPITPNALRGNLPYAVSPLSITASAPSRTAIAMSDTCRKHPGGFENPCAHC